MNFNKPDSHKGKSLFPETQCLMTSLADAQKQGGRFNRQRSRSNPENEYPSKYQAFQKFENPVEAEVRPLVPQNIHADREEKKEEAKNNQESRPNRDMIQKIDIRCLHEEIKDMNNIQIPTRDKSNRKNNAENWKDLAQAQPGQMRGILQHFQEFLPWDFQNMQDNIQSARHHDTRNCPGNIYRLRKSPKSPVKSLVPNEPYLKLTVLFL